MIFNACVNVYVKTFSLSVDLESYARVVGWHQCVANCGFTVSEPKVPFRRKLQDVEVQEKMSAMLTCELPLNTTQASWFMEETRLEQSSKYHMEQEGTLRRLTIHNVTTNDDGVYICEMKEGSRTVAELTVLGRSTPMVLTCEPMWHACRDFVVVYNLHLNRKIHEYCLYFKLLFY